MPQGNPNPIQYNDAASSGDFFSISATDLSIPSFINALTDLYIASGGSLYLNANGIQLQAATDTGVIDALIPISGHGDMGLQIDAGSKLVQLIGYTGSGGNLVVTGGDGDVTITSPGLNTVRIGAVGSFDSVEIAGDTNCKVGFFGTGPVSKQSSTGVTTVAQLIAKLQNYGLLT